MKVRVYIEREFDFDAEKCLAEDLFAPPDADASQDEREAWLRESFYELLSDFRSSDQDHIDGSYVSLVDESDHVDFDFGAVPGTDRRKGGPLDGCQDNDDVFLRRVRQDEEAARAS